MKTRKIHLRRDAGPLCGHILGHNWAEEAVYDVSWYLGPGYAGGPLLPYERMCLECLDLLSPIEYLSHTEL